MNVKCKYCGKVLDKEDSIILHSKEQDGYYCLCSNECLLNMVDGKVLIDKLDDIYDILQEIVERLDNRRDTSHDICWDVF